MRIHVLKFVTIVGLGMFCVNVNGQTSLTDLVNYTIKHSREIKKSELQCKEANYIRREAIGQGLPQISGSSSYSRMSVDIDIPESAYGIVNGYLPATFKPMALGMLDQISSIDALYSASAAIQVTQLIYSQAYIEGLKTTKKTQELYSILKTKTEEDVIAEVALGYYQVGSLMLQLQTIEKSISNLKEIYRITELSYNNDLVKESTVNRLKVTITNLDVTKQTLENGIVIQLNYLKALSGMPADSALHIDAAVLINDFISNEPNANFNIEQVPAYLALLKQDEIFKQQIQLTRAKYYPTIAAFGKYSYSSYNTESKIEDWNNMNTIGISLSLPIFSSGVTNAKVNQALLKRAQLHEDILKTKDLLSVNYNNAYLEYQTAREMLDAQKENKALALKVYNQTSLQYEEGMASMADLLNVNSDYLQADNSLNQQLMKCKTAEIKMLKASGNLKSLIK